MFPQLRNARKIKKRSAHHVFSNIALEPAKRPRVEDLEPGATEPQVPPNIQGAPDCSEETPLAPDDEIIKRIHRPQVCPTFQGIRTMDYHQ